jgi:hypothetical protein
MHAAIFLSLVLFQAPAGQSPFNSYEVFLTPRKLGGTCAGEDPDQFRNRTYTFRSHVYPAEHGVTLHDGEVVERNLLGTAEWETSLVAVEPVKVETRMRTLLIIGANHVNGTGGATHVLVVECRNRELTVWFEAGGEGIRDASFEAAGQELSVSRWIWSPTDAHCCPGREGQERYRWRRSAARFVRVGWVERVAPPK